MISKVHPSVDETKMKILDLTVSLCGGYSSLNSYLKELQELSRLMLLEVLSMFENFFVSHHGT